MKLIYYKTILSLSSSLPKPIPEALYWIQVMAYLVAKGMNTSAALVILDTVLSKTIDKVIRANSTIELSDYDFTFGIFVSMVLSNLDEDVVQIEARFDSRTGKAVADSFRWRKAQ